jgi:hypothetical protein
MATSRFFAARELPVRPVFSLMTVETGELRRCLLVQNALISVFSSQVILMRL